jgi:hypothetical protein
VAGGRGPRLGLEEVVVGDVKSDRGDGDGDERRLPAGHARERGRCLDPLDGGFVPEMRQPLEPSREVPVPVAEELHRRRPEHRRPRRTDETDVRMLREC